MPNGTVLYRRGLWKLKSGRDSQADLSRRDHAEKHMLTQVVFTMNYPVSPAKWKIIAVDFRNAILKSGFYVNM